MLDNCKKVGVVFESLVACFEAVNCSGLQVQCTTSCPSLNVDKTDGAQVRGQCYTAVLRLQASVLHKHDMRSRGEFTRDRRRARAVVAATGLPRAVRVRMCAAPLLTVAGVQIFLPHATAQATEITTAKASAVNVTVLPAEGDEADPVEHPVPEQFVSKFVEGKLVTGPVAHG